MQAETERRGDPREPKILFEYNDNGYYLEDQIIDRGGHGELHRRSYKQVHNGENDFYFGCHGYIESSLKKEFIPSRSINLNSRAGRGRRGEVTNARIIILFFSQALLDTAGHRILLHA